MYDVLRNLMPIEMYDKMVNEMMKNRTESMPKQRLTVYNGVCGI